MENGDDSNWKWGCFYYNPEDKRLFPPKRDPAFGWTINFASIKSIIAFIILFALIGAYILFIAHRAGK